MFGFQKKQPEKVNDEVIGEIVYLDNSWGGTADFKLFGTVTEIDVDYLAPEKEPVSAEQRAAYQKIIGNDALAAKIEKILNEEFPADEYGELSYQPVSICIKRNGDCALIVAAGEGDDAYSSRNVAVSIFPETKFYGSDEAYMSAYYFAD